MSHLIDQISKEMNISQASITNTLQLLEDGNTVPFIARYRKEVTKGLDEEQIRLIQEHYQYQLNLQKRKEDVLRLIETQGKLTDEIRQEIASCEKISQVDDIYRPYQLKRKTRASEAEKKGLKPFAQWILQRGYHVDVVKEANRYINEDVKTIDDAIQGAKDIIAEMISDDAKVRDCIRTSMMRYGTIVTRVKKDHNDDKKVYRMYYEYAEPIVKIASHRLMAIDRGEKEKVLSVSIDFDKQRLEEYLFRKKLVKATSPCDEYIKEAILDGLKRLAYPSVEREIRKELTSKAQEQSMDVFSMNLERLLLQPPMKDKMILGFDPAFRTGCKLAVVDKNGKMLEVSVIYPTPPNAKIEEAKKKICDLCTKYPIDIVAIGNGTASRESEAFIAGLIKEKQLPISYAIVSEAGASVYSASNLAREEFPDLQVEQRSAISIARRMIDPLAELIKIDPQSIGVGQYQHDLASARLKERLSFVVEKAVNRVGVNVNTASVELLKNVSGISSACAKAIVKYRDEHGDIKTRAELKKVPRMGEKSFEQAAGFLRIEDGDEIFDRTPIHPESYQIAKRVLEMLELSVTDMGSEKAKSKIQQINVVEFAKALQSDTYTIQDILEAIAMPLRDYRDQFDGPILKSDVLELEDLHVGDQLEGVVRNVVDFGAFVDIGLHEDGLVHISKMSRKRIKHPSELLAVGDIVKVWVYQIDTEREKVQLSLIKM